MAQVVRRSACNQQVSHHCGFESCSSSPSCENGSILPRVRAVVHQCLIKCLGMSSVFMWSCLCPVVFKSNCSGMRQIQTVDLSVQSLTREPPDHDDDDRPKSEDHIYRGYPSPWISERSRFYHNWKSKGLLPCFHESYTLRQIPNFMESQIHFNVPVIYG